MNPEEVFAFITSGYGENEVDEALTRALDEDICFEDCNFREPEWCPGVIIAVRDGDTLIVLVCTNILLKSWVEVAIRLYGIDAPETRTKDRDEKRLGLKAKRYLKDKSEMKRAVFHLSGERTFDRWVGRGWFLDGQGFGEMMVEAGLAEWEYL